MFKPAKIKKIGQYFHYFFILGFTAGLLSSCTSSASFIKAAALSGPAKKSMIRITENPDNENFTLRCQYAQNLEREINTSASDVNYIYTSNYPPLEIDPQNNVHWQLPETELLFDLEISLSRHVVVFGGLNAGATDGKTALGKTIGLGLRDEKHNVNMRLDISLNIQDMNYEVIYGHETEWIWGVSSSREMYDQGTMTSKNLGLFSSNSFI